MSLIKSENFGAEHLHQCVTCKNLVALDKEDMIIQAFDSDKLASLFSVFCKFMGIIPEHSLVFDFKKEPFPFCKGCKLSLIQLFQLTEQMSDIKRKLSDIRGKFRSQMTMDHQEDDELNESTVAKRPRTAHTATKISQLRSRLLQRLSPEDASAESSSTGGQVKEEERPHCSKAMPELLPARRLLTAREQRPEKHASSSNVDELSSREDSSHIEGCDSPDDSDIVFDTTPLFLVKGETELRVYDEEDSNFPSQEYGEVLEDSGETSSMQSTNQMYQSDLIGTDSSGKTWLQCPYCPKKFAHASKWKRHVPIHADTKTYVCKICTKGFCEKYRVVRHLQSNHNCNPEDIESNYVFNGL